MQQNMNENEIHQNADRTKTCFVIMPYGSTEDEEDHFLEVYDDIIESAVKDCGLICKRSDLSPMGGHILDSVINDLATSDIVIADLSKWNWNVAYELGIRYSLRRHGTILLCDQDTNKKIPFDISEYRYISYPSVLTHKGKKAPCDALKKAILACLENGNALDSPVFRVLPDHPDYFDCLSSSKDPMRNSQDKQLERFTSLAETLGDQIIQRVTDYIGNQVIRATSFSGDDVYLELQTAKERIKELETQLNATSQTYNALPSTDPSLEITGSTEISRFLAELQNSIYYSDEAVKKLRQLILDGDKEGFVKFLSKVLDVGYLDEPDCKAVYRMCRNLNVPAITTMYLESVIKKFHPDNDDLIGYLANEYSRNPQTRDKALEMVNSIVGVTKADNQYQLTDSVQLTEGKLAAFFDVYIHLNMYSDILDIGSLICMHNSDNAKISSITLRNMANAAIRLEKFSDGKVYLDMLLKVDASNDIVHWIYSQYYNAIEDYPAAISEIETCIRLDRNDTDYYFAMAAYICDDYIARDPQTLMIQKIGPNESAEYAVPFLITALTIDPSVRSRVLDFLRRNKFTAYIAPLVEAYEVDTDDFRSVFPNLDYRSVDYCLGVESK